jgi:hypothetical protein
MRTGFRARLAIEVRAAVSRAMLPTPSPGPILAKVGASSGETPVLETVGFKRELDDDFDVWARAQAWLIHRLNVAAEASGLGAM